MLSKILMNSISIFPISIIIHLLFIVQISSSLPTILNQDFLPIRHIQCPSNFSLRNSGIKQSQKLNDDESTYLLNRRQQVVAPAYLTYLRNVKHSLKKVEHEQNKNRTKSDSIAAELYTNLSPSVNNNHDSLPDYLESILTSNDLDTLPHTAFAASGGGYRASLYSSGVLNGFDGRNKTSNHLGTGGLLQASDYLVGLSGGSWVVTASAQAGFPTFYDLILSKPHSHQEENLQDPQFGSFLLQFDLFSPANNQTVPDDNQIEDQNSKFLTNVLMKMGLKLQAGFYVTMADFWSLVLRYHITNGTTEENFFDHSLSHGLNITFSGIQNLSTFQRFEQPFPIITALAISPGQDESQKQPKALIPLTNTAYEFTPIESGSWDENLASFIPTEYLGTRLRLGRSESNQCVQGFDQASYLSAISSDIFPSFNTSETFFFGQSPIHTIISLINTTFSSLQPGISTDTASVPNPFLEVGSDTYLDKHSTELRLLDGGLDGAVTPYLPLLIPARKVDIIIGIDALSLVDDGTDGPNYATGASLQATFARAQLVSGAYSFPQVPSTEEEYEILRSHPTFFGCDETDSPLIVWIANSAPLDGSTGITNTSLDQTQYSTTQAEAFLGAASEIAYRGFPRSEDVEKGEFRDPLWSVCLACAVVDRSRARQNISRDGLCRPCFERYCWSP
ncbi:lysophospholipase catalytic domain-containing protein [Melampsora americana]|nr:lysophospholipase catalytic domain-containing protein [Melampsora americana]